MPSILVSVIITTKNRFEALSRALKSVENQTYKDIEVIVVDDGSNEEISRKNKKMVEGKGHVYFYNKVSQGACYARNVGISNSNGYFVTGLDDDDEFTNNRIERLVECAQLNKEEHSLYCSHSLILDEYGTESYEKEQKQLLNLNDMLLTNKVGSQALVKKDYICEVGMFDESLLASQDHDMWLRVIEKYGAAYKLKERLYVCHDDARLLRVSSNKIKGLKQFYKKHSVKMT